MTKRMLATLLSMIMFLIPLTTSAIALATTITTVEFDVSAEVVNSNAVVTTRQEGATDKVSVIVEDKTLNSTEDGIEITDGATGEKKNISNELLIEDLNNVGDNDDLAEGDPNKNAIDGENEDEDDIFIDNMPSSGSGTTVVTGSPSDVDKFKNESGESRTGQVTTEQLNGATTDAETLEKAKAAKLNELNKLKSQLKAKALASATDAQRTLLNSTATTTASKTDIINSILSDADKKQYKDVNYTIDMVSSASSTSILLNSGISIETDKSGTWTTLNGEDALLMTITAQAFGSSNLLTINEQNEVIADVSGIKNIILNIDTSGSMADSMGSGQTRWSVLCAAVEKFVENMFAAAGENVKITLIAYNGGENNYNKIVRTVGTYSVASQSDLLGLFNANNSADNGFGFFANATGGTDSEAGYFETNKVIEKLKETAGSSFNPNNVSVVFMTDGEPTYQLHQASQSMYKDRNGNLYTKVGDDFYSVANNTKVKLNHRPTEIDCPVYKDANGVQYYAVEQKNHQGDVTSAKYYSVASNTELNDADLTATLTPVKVVGGDYYEEYETSTAEAEAAANEAVELLKKGVNLYNIVITNDDKDYDYNSGIRQYFDPTYEKASFSWSDNGDYKISGNYNNWVYYKVTGDKVEVYRNDGVFVGTVDKDNNKFEVDGNTYNINDGTYRYSITKTDGYLKSRIEMVNNFAQTGDANYTAIRDGKIDFTVAKNANGVTGAYEKIASSIVNQIATKALIAYNAGVIDEIPAGYDVVLSPTSKGFATVTNVSGTDENGRQIITWNIGDMFNAEEYKLEYFLVPKAKITDDEGEAFERYGVTSVGSKAALFCDAVDGRKDLVIVLDNPVIDLAPSNRPDELGTVVYTNSTETVILGTATILNNDSHDKQEVVGATVTDIKVEGLSETAKVELVADGTTTTLEVKAVEKDGNVWKIALKYGTVSVDESGNVSFQYNKDVDWTFDEYRDTAEEIRSIKVTFEYKVSTDVTVRTNLRTLSSILVPVSFNITPPVAPRYSYGLIVKYVDENGNVVGTGTTQSVSDIRATSSTLTATPSTLDFDNETYDLVDNEATTTTLVNTNGEDNITGVVRFRVSKIPVYNYELIVKYVDENGNVVGTGTTQSVNGTKATSSTLTATPNEAEFDNDKYDLVDTGSTTTILTYDKNTGEVIFRVNSIKYNYSYDVNFVATGTNAGEILGSFTNVGNETNTTETSKTFNVDPSASDFEDLIQRLYDLGYDFVDKDGNRVNTASKTTIATLAEDLMLTATKENRTATGSKTFYLKLLDYSYSYDVVFKATGTDVELGSVTGLGETTTTATTTTFSASPSAEALRGMIDKLYKDGYDFVNKNGEIITSKDYEALKQLVEELKLEASRANPDAKATATFYLKPFEYEYFYNIVFKALNEKGEVLDSFEKVGTKKDTATTTTFTVNPNTETDTAITARIAQLLNDQGYDFIQGADGNVIDLTDAGAVAAFVKTLKPVAGFRQETPSGVTATFYLKPFEYNYAYNVNFVLDGTDDILASFTNQEATRSTLRNKSYTVDPANFTIPAGYELVDSKGETVDLTAAYKKADTVSKDVVFYLRAISVPPVEPPVEPDTPVEPPVVPDEPPVTPVDPPVVPVEPEPVPLANPDNTVEIPADATPLVKQRSWALVNLICVVLSLIGAVLTFFAGHKADKEENERLKANGMEEKKNEKFRKTKLFGALMAIAGAIVFIVTELPLIHMIYVDRWTIVNVILLLVHGVGSIYGLRKKNDKQDDTETSNA